MKLSFIGVSVAAVTLAIVSMLSAAVVRSQHKPLPEWLKDARCSIVSQDGKSIAADPQQLPCRELTGTLSCDAANALPFDVAANAACEGVGLPWVQGTGVRIKASVPEALIGTTVEWVDISGEGTPRVLARRPLGDGRAVLVPASEKVQASTVLRFLRNNASPFSVGADAAGRASELSIPEKTPGGELFIIVPRVVFQPVEYRVIGSGRNVSVDAGKSNWVRLGAVNPGSYQVVPRYVGGFSGIAQGASVKLDETTYVRFQLPVTGALHVSTDDALCRGVGQVEISGGLRRTAGTAPVRDTFTASVADCRLRVEGLLPGTYTVGYRSKDPSVHMSQKVAIGEGAATDIAFAFPGTLLTGHVLRDGSPLEGRVELVLTPKDVAAGTLAKDSTTAVDATGHFQIGTDREGEYRATLRLNGSLIPGLERFVTLTKGTNTLNWDVPGGRLKVRVSNWDRSSPVRVVLQLPPKSVGAVVETQVVANVTDQMPLIVEALPFEKYKVQAIQEQANGVRLISALVDVSLDPANPTREAMLELKDYRLLIAVSDAHRRPITDAIVTVGEGQPLKAVGDGLFQVTSADGSAGAGLVVSAPGFAPTCVIAPQNERLDVVLQPGRPAVLTFVETPFDLPSLPGTVRWAGSQCGVAFKRFEHKLVSGNKAAGQWVFAIQNLPTADALIVLWSAFDTDATAETVRITDQMRVSLKRYGERK